MYAHLFFQSIVTSVGQPKASAYSRSYVCFHVRGRKLERKLSKNCLHFRPRSLQKTVTELNELLFTIVLPANEIGTRTSATAAESNMILFTTSATHYFDLYTLNDCKLYLCQNRKNKNCCRYETEISNEHIPLLNI